MGFAMPGRPWTLAEERKLRDMLEAGESLDTIALELGRNKDAISVKAKRLGLVVAQGPYAHTTTMLDLPQDLMSPEDALKILVAALNTSKQAGLDKVEVQRLMAVATLARTYTSLWKDYERFKEVEKGMIEIDRRLAALEATAEAFREKPAEASNLPDADRSQDSNKEES